MNNYAMPVGSVKIIHSATDYFELLFTANLVQKIRSPVLLVGTDTVEA
jgi:hypothetical protein